MPPTLETFGIVSPGYEAADKPPAADPDGHGGPMRTVSWNEALTKALKLSKQEMINFSRKPITRSGRWLGAWVEQDPGELAGSGIKVGPISGRDQLTSGTNQRDQCALHWLVDVFMIICAAPVLSLLIGHSPVRFSVCSPRDGPRPPHTHLIESIIMIALPTSFATCASLRLFAAHSPSRVPDCFLDSALSLYEGLTSFIKEAPLTIGLPLLCPFFRMPRLMHHRHSTQLYFRQCRLLTTLFFYMAVATTPNLVYNYRAERLYTTMGSSPSIEVR